MYKSRPVRQHYFEDILIPTLLGNVFSLPNKFYDQSKINKKDHLNNKDLNTRKGSFKLFLSLVFRFVRFELYEQYVRKDAIFPVEVGLYYRYSNRITFVKQAINVSFTFNLIPIMPTGRLRVLN
jgi:hypothetical protein